MRNIGCLVSDHGDRSETIRVDLDYGGIRLAVGTDCDTATVELWLDSDTTGTLGETLLKAADDVIH